MSTQFQLGLNIDETTLKPPRELAPGYDFTEVPITEMLLPYDDEATWQKQRAEMKAWGLPPFKAASHFLRDEMICGPVVDFPRLKELADIEMRRLAEVGVPCAGIWGAFFALPDGFSKTTATDQALTYCEMLAGLCEKYGVLIALEPMARRETLFPSYKEGLAFAKRVNHPMIRVMADLNYFVELDEPLEDIKEDPSYCLHVHIQGDKYQPNYGNREPQLLHLFRVLRDIGYTLGVSAASPWTITEGDTFNYRLESAKTLAYMQELRVKVYMEG
jgi:sugar phosphate isomerase/epimerase